MSVKMTSQLVLSHVDVSTQNFTNPHVNFTYHLWLISFSNVHSNDISPIYHKTMLGCTAKMCWSFKSNSHEWNTCHSLIWRFGTQFSIRQNQCQKAKYIWKLSSKTSKKTCVPLPTSFLLNIQSRLKQEVHMLQIQNWVTRYSSPYWCPVPNIRKLASVVPEKNVTEIFCDANADARPRKTTEVIPICRLR